MIEIVIAAGILIICLFLLALLMGGTNIRFHSKAKAGQVRLACIGDSTTYGTVIPNVFYNCYPAQLGRMLGGGYHVANFGFNAKTALDVNDNSFRKTNQFPLSLEYQPNIVIIMLGTNDTMPQNWVSQAEFKEHYRSLIQSYMDLDSKPQIIVCTPNSAYHVHGKTEGSYNYGINEEKLLLECGAIKELVTEMDVAFIDMYEVTAGHPEWYKFDGIHPNKNGAKAVAAVVCKKITGQSV